MYMICIVKENVIWIYIRLRDCVLRIKKNNSGSINSRQRQCHSDDTDSLYVEEVTAGGLVPAKPSTCLNGGEVNCHNNIGPGTTKDGRRFFFVKPQKKTVVKRALHNRKWRY